MIPFFDLKRQYKSLREELNVAQDDVFQSGMFLKSSKTKAFEKSFSEYLNIPHCIACASGTDGLELTLRALNLPRDSEVIVPALTWVSDAEAVLNIGLSVKFADVDPRTGCITTETIKTHLSEKTKALIVVHLYGQMAKMNDLMELADCHHIYVIEDCSHAHGAYNANGRAGTFGHTGVFSFYPTKNLGAYGDAGAVITSDEAIAQQVRLLADHGQVRRDQHKISGSTSRIDELQAAFLEVKLKYLDRWNERRRAIATYYTENLKNVWTPSISEGHVVHQYVIRVREREKMLGHLRKHELGYAIHYPAILPSLEPFFEENWKSSYPVATDIAQQAISLPIFPELTDSEVENVVKIVNSFI